MVRHESRRGEEQRKITRRIQIQFNVCKSLSREKKKTTKSQPTWLLKPDSERLWQYQKFDTFHLNSHTAIESVVLLCCCFLCNIWLSVLLSSMLLSSFVVRWFFFTSSNRNCLYGNQVYYLFFTSTYFDGMLNCTRNSTHTTQQRKCNKIFKERRKNPALYRTVCDVKVDKFFSRLWTVQWNISQIIKYAE